jgi:phage tail sheath protein FI
MPEYLAPGVYVEERPAPQTIEGVSTSIAGFVGAAARGQTVGLPQLVTSFPDFVRRYGGHLGEEWGVARHLASAVEGFFSNGGQQAYIARVVGAGAAAAARVFFDGFNTRLLEDTSATDDTARLASLRGVSVGSHLSFSETFAGSPRTETRRVMTYAVATRTVSLDAPLGVRFTAARCVVTLEGIPAPTTAGSVPTVRIEARNEGEWGNTLRVVVGDTTGATALASAAAVSAVTELVAVALAFAAAGPESGATKAELAAVDGLVEDESILEFADDAGNAERRTVTGIDGNIVSWDRPLANDYSATGTTVVRTNAVLVPEEPRLLAFETAGPAAGAQNVNLADATGVAAGDVLELRDPAPPAVERVVVTAVTDGTVAWSGGLTGDYTGADTTVRHHPSPRADVADVAGLSPGDLVRITQDDRTQVLEIATVTGDQLAFNAASYPLLGTYDAGAQLALALAGTGAGTSVDLGSANNFYRGAIVEIDRGGAQTYHRVASVTGNTLVLDAALDTDVPHGATVRVAELLIVVDDGGTTERFDNLSLDPNAANYAPRVVNLQSRLVRLTDLSSPSAPPFNLPRVDWSESTGDPRLLTGGSEGSRPPAAGAFLGRDLGPGQRSGIAALADVDAVSMMAVPGIADPSVHAALLGQCEERKDRFAVLDPLQGSVIGSGGPDDVVLQRNRHDSLYGAIYYPWLRVRDPLDAESTEGLLVPPSGHVLGIYARTDTERGVHKAPANEVIRGITGLEVKLSDREQAVLNPANINVIRDFTDSRRGLRVWGARCITSNGAWRYVPVRRLFIFLEESLYVGLQFVVFEPNAEPLWARVRRTVAGFLRRVWLDGALEGATEEEAFFVTCDRSTMTDDDIANGRLIVVVGAAPVRPAEFVIIRITQKTREAVA